MTTFYIYISESNWSVAKKGLLEKQLKKMEKIKGKVVILTSLVVGLFNINTI